MEDASVSSEVRQAFDRYHFNMPVAQIAAPRRRGTSRWVVATGIGIVALSLWVASAFPPAGQPRVAFAGWAPVPTLSDATLAAAAASACSIGDAGPMSLVAQDQRGNAATMLYAGGGQLSICLVLRDGTGAVVAAASGLTRLAGSADPLVLDTGMSSDKSPQSDGLWIVAGRVTPEVRSVIVSRTAGPDVAATVSSGYFVAWWPTADKATTITAKDAAGTELAVVPGLH